MAMTEQAHHCSSGLTKTFTCVQLSNTYLSATLTTATFPTAAACRGFDACACTPTPRDLHSSHWQLRLHFIWKGSQPFIYRCAPRGTRTCPLTLQKKYHNAILNHIKSAKKQADNVVLEIPTFVSRRVIGKTINGYMKQSSKGRIIIVKHGNKCYVYK